MDKNTNYIPRTDYLQKVEPFIGKALIKVFTGQRRVGKSIVMRQMADYITLQAPQTNIIYIDKEQFRFTDIIDARTLYDYVKSQRKAGENSLFIDEVQEIENFHLALRSFLNEGMCDIYVTGSNAHMLSGELATLLAGRYVEVHVHALGYKEFLLFNALDDSDEALRKYLTIGSMPYLHNLHGDEAVAFEYLRNVYSSILLKDVVSREAIRNPHFLEGLVAFLSDNIGSITTANNISRYLKSQHISIPTQSVLNYLRALSNAFFIYRVQRADIAGLKIFEVGDKYYFEDWGIRNAIHRFNMLTDIGKLIENVVFIELLRREYTVYVGKSDTKEVDFIAERNGRRAYLQVAYTISDKNTADREFAPLTDIHDNYPKYVITMDPITLGERQGIHHITLRHFLTSHDI